MITHTLSQGITPGLYIDRWYFLGVLVYRRERYLKPDERG